MQGERLTCEESLSRRTGTVWSLLAWVWQCRYAFREPVNSPFGSRVPKAANMGSPHGTCWINSVWGPDNVWWFIVESRQLKEDRFWNISQSNSQLLQWLLNIDKDLQAGSRRMIRYSKWCVKTLKPRKFLWMDTDVLFIQWGQSAAWKIQQLTGSSHLWGFATASTRPKTIPHTLRC